MSGDDHHARPVSPTGDCLGRRPYEHDQASEQSIEDEEQGNPQDEECKHGEIYPAIEERDDLGLDQDIEQQPSDRIRRATLEPTKAEREAHVITHMPFRSWCETCMRARGIATGHRVRRRPDGHELPVLSIDYAFLRHNAGENSMAIVVMKDSISKAIVAHSVPCKGVEVDWVAKQLVKDIRKLGYYDRVVLKSDQEPAIVALLDQMAQERSEAPTTLEHSPVTDSQANGSAERAVRSVEEMVRTYKIDLQERTQGLQLPIDHPAMEWMVEHAADMLCKGVTGTDGKSPYKRLKGRSYQGELLPFACPVLFRCVGKVKGGVLADRWYPGLWLGKRFASDEHLVGFMGDGRVYRCRSVQALRRPPTASELDAVVGRPSAPTGTMHSGVDVPHRADDKSIEREEPVPFQPRNLYITGDMLKKFGGSTACNKCRLIQYQRSHKGIAHSAACRARIEKCVMEDPDLRLRLEQAEERKTRYLAEEVERTSQHTVRREVQADRPERPSAAIAEDVDLQVPEAYPDVLGAASPRGPVAPQGGVSGPSMSASSGSASASGLRTNSGIASASVSGSAGSRQHTEEHQCQQPDADKREQKRARVGEGQQESDGNGSTAMDDDEGMGPIVVERSETVGGVKRESEGGEDEPVSRRRLNFMIGELHSVFSEDGGNHDDPSKGEPFDYEGDHCLEDLELREEDLTWVPQHLKEKAMKTELETLDQMGTFRESNEQERQNCAEAVDVDAKWVLTNKGTRANPQIKARLVCREFAEKDGRDGELFAGTPGLMAVRLLLSMHCTGKLPNKILALLDVKGAFLYGMARRHVFVRLPDGRVVKLIKSLYGTRDAPMIWADHLADTLTQLGLIRTKLNPAVWTTKDSQLHLAVHVDDLLISGSRQAVKELTAQLDAIYTLKKAFVGPGESQSGEYLGRTVRVSKSGIEWTHGGKYVENLMKIYGMEDCKEAPTPIVIDDVRGEGPQDQRPLMSPQDARRFRKAAATINYLAQDRPDLGVASSFCARSMANPRVGDEVRIKRCIRYLKGKPFLSIYYDQQDQDQSHTFTLYTDSDWATCKTTRRSTSGGVLLHGQHLVGHWCKVQGKIAPSSGEAELMSANVGLSSLAGVVQLHMELTGSTIPDYELHHKIDAAACRGMLLRRGAGAIKHLEVRDMWGQEIIRRLGVILKRIPRKENVSDMMASINAPKDFMEHLSNLGLNFFMTCQEMSVLDVLYSCLGM